MFDPRCAESWVPLNVLNQKFLARVGTRRVARDLRERERLASAGVTRGGGLPLIQGWTPARGESNDRTFIAEIRWWGTKPGGELRFGVDFAPRPDQVEDEEVRRAAYDLARSMDAAIDYPSLREHLFDERPDLAELLRRDKPSRPKTKGDWERVIVHGFKGLRFQAIAEIDFGRASASDLTDLIGATLSYLSSREILAVSATPQV